MGVMRISALLCVLGLLLPLLSHFLAGSNNALSWLIDLASHWQWIFLFGLVICVSVTVWSSMRWAVLLLAVPLPWLTASAHAPASEKTGGLLKVASINVNLSNRDIQPLAAWLSKEQVDVAVVLEVSQEYASRLQALAEYPFKRIAPHDGPFGIALISRHPLLRSEVIHDADGIAHIEAQLKWQERVISFVAMHPMPPLSPHYHAVRDGKLRALADAAVASGIPTALAGDFNATPWSSAFSGLAERGVHRATGLAASWPAKMRGILGIPIDHILVTSQWAVATSRTGPDLGSDHLPVLVGLSLVD